MQVWVDGVEDGRSLVVVALEEPLDMERAPDVRVQLLKIVRSKSVGALAIDVSRMDSMDSAGLAILVELVDVLGRKGGRVELRGVSGSMQRFMALARLEELFQRRGA